MEKIDDIAAKDSCVSACGVRGRVACRLARARAKQRKYELLFGCRQKNTLKIKHL